VKQTHRTPKTENPGAGGRGAMRRRGTMNAARNLTTKQISDELDVLEGKWRDMRSNDDGGRGGSPGEWLVERMDELETELARRKDAGIAG
jgi:hypothetical protein